MSITKEQKAELVAKYGDSPTDTGNPKVQVAIHTFRIKELTEHMKIHKKDLTTRRGLITLVNKRRALLNYITKHQGQDSYKELIDALGIRR